ncbi:MAG: hypothetical protein ABIA75_04005 [Candidatus Neomarinimicrobiota bacterium]
MSQRKPNYLFTAIDPENRAIHMADHTADHIIAEHGSASLDIPKIKETIESPDCIKESELNPESLIYVPTTETNKDFNVTTLIGPEFADGIVTSSYISSRALKGKIVWKK